MSRYRSVAIQLVTAALLLNAASAASAQAPRYAFDEPERSLSQALRELALRSGHNLIAPADLVGSRRALPLSGSLTAEEALARLLEGTGLRARLLNGTLIIEREGAGAAATVEEREQSAITVTGTRIRGSGSASPVTIASRKDLEQSGISDLADFTRLLPQNYSGGQNRGIAGGGEQGGQQNLNNSATLNLRGLGPDATLTLLNGHRLAYDTINQGVDLSAIPLSGIERIEVVADGSSALYGSDAVGGVANIILRRAFDGVEATARIGASTDGGNFQKQLSLVGGHRWQSGGFMVAADANSATPIYARQRAYARSVDDSLTLTSRNRQWSGVLSASQDLVPGLTLEADGYVMVRRSRLQNPFRPDADVRVSGLVSRPHVRSHAFTPTLRAEFGPWRALLSGTLSRSRTLLDTENYANSVPRRSHLLYDNHLKGAEISAEGPLFTLPGGDARLAAGGGLRAISLHLRYQNLIGGERITTRDFTERRSVRFGYAELSLPLASPDLGLPLVNRLTVSGAVRYEHWKGIGDVTTPKLGLVYQPVPDLTLRGAWGKSFKIPTLREVNQVEEGALVPGFYFVPPPHPAGSTVLLLTGTAAGLKPEKAVTWSGTVELRPRAVPGLELRATYFNVDYRDRIAAPVASLLTALSNPIYSDFITYNPTAAEVNALLATLPGGLVNQTGAPFDPSNVGAIIDSALRNTERQRVRGVDFNAVYRFHLEAGGSLLLTGSASYLESDQRTAPGQPLLRLAGTVFNPPHWRGRAGIAWSGGRADASAFVNYVGSRLDNRFPVTDRIPPFVTMDVSAGIRTGERSGLLSGLELRVTALNLLDARPNHIRNAFPNAAPFDSTNESPVGRFVGASLRKSW